MRTAMLLTAMLLAMGTALPACASAHRHHRARHTIKVRAATARVPLPPHLTIVRDPAAAMEFCNQGRAEDEVAPVPACSDGDTVYLTDMAGSFDRWHETGHVFDDEVLTDENRVEFTRLLGFKPGSWLRGYENLNGAPVTFMAGVRSPSEHFADAYAACALGLDPDSNWVDGYGYHPSARQHRRVCRALWAASRSAFSRRTSESTPTASYSSP
jgi:hypothetical protein